MMFVWILFYLRCGCFGLWGARLTWRRHRQSFRSSGRLLRFRRSNSRLFLREQRQPWKLPW
jgi:hypothetical protein